MESKETYTWVPDPVAMAQHTDHPRVDMQNGLGSTLTALKGEVWLTFLPPSKPRQEKIGTITKVAGLYGIAFTSAYETYTCLGPETLTALAKLMQAINEGAQ